MNTTSHKMPALWVTMVLVMGLLYACPETDSSEDGYSIFSNRDNTSKPTLTAGDITYNNIAQGTEGIAKPKSSKTSNFSGMTFSIASISTHTGTQVRPAIAEDGTITTAADTTAGSYRVTMTPDGSTILGDPFTVDFYVTVKATDTADLDTKLQTAIANYGLTGDFNYIDTSAVTNMTNLFAFDQAVPGGVKTNRTYVINFNGDISKWDVSAVKNFSFMFARATAFNQDIGGWDVSAGTNFSWMFNEATVFNQNIGKWNVSVGKDFFGMFNFARAFNQDIGDWNVSSGTNFYRMFLGATAFNQDLSRWQVDDTDFTANMFDNSGMANNPPAWYP